MPAGEAGAHGPKVIGRVLSLGFPLPGANVDNYNFLTAPAFFDYDAIVVDPAALSALVEGVRDGSIEAATFGGAAVRVKPAAAGEVALTDVLLRRRDETRMLLDRGGVAVCFAQPARALALGAESESPLDNYYWLPAPSGIEYAPPFVVAAEGSQARVVDYQHPLAAFVHSQLANVAYRAHFDLSRASGTTVFGRSRGGAAIAVEPPMPHGRVIFLPAMNAIPAGEARYAMSDALQDGIRRALGVIAEGRPPYWVADHPVPGLDDRTAEAGRLRAEFDDARAALEAADSAQDALARYQRLLWQEGALGLDDVVLDALRLIGFEVYASDPENIELRVPPSPVSVLVEIESSERPIDLAPHYRLRQRIERAIERRGEAPRGLLVVNGQRLEPPARRTEVTDALRVAAETMRYCIAPTSTLFAAVVAHLAGDTAAAEAYRERLMTTHGLIEPI